MPAASALIGIVPSEATTLATTSWDEYATPTTPPVSRAPAISPAAIVPWPSLSTHGLPPTKLFFAAIWFWKSGSEQSTPESTIATFTVASGGGAGQASNALSWLRYHCFAKYAFAGVNAKAADVATSAATTATSSASPSLFTTSR